MPSYVMTSCFWQFVDHWQTLISGVFALIAGILLYCIGRKQASLAREAIALTNRPVLRVRRIILEGFFAMYGAEMISHMDNVEAKIIIVNVGGTQAHIIDSRYRIQFYKGDIPAALTYDDPPHRLTAERITLVVGQRYDFQLTGQAALNDPGNGMRIIRQFAGEGWSMVIHGEITYRDGTGRDRLTGFLRVWSHGRFRRVRDPDYEYED